MLIFFQSDSCKHLLQTVTRANDADVLMIRPTFIACLLRIVYSDALKDLCIYVFDMDGNTGWFVLWVILKFNKFRIHIVMKKKS